VFDDVAEVRGVEGGEREVVGEAVCGDPGVVLRAGSAAAGSVGGDLAPDPGDSPRRTPVVIAVQTSAPQSGSRHDSLTIRAA
jgi:hypothetical protein